MILLLELLLLELLERAGGLQVILLALFELHLELPVRLLGLRQRHGAA